MTEPTPTPEFLTLEVSEPTQTQHPWRATVRTVVAVALPLLPALPEIARALGVATVPVVAGIIAGAAAVTRVLALPEVQAALHRSGWSSWLAATPPQLPPAE